MKRNLKFWNISYMAYLINLVMKVPTFGGVRDVARVKHEAQDFGFVETEKKKFFNEKICNVYY